jgi:uncharacterized protein (TIGR02611 family)
MQLIRCRPSMTRKLRIKLASLGYKQARRVVVFVLGMTILLFGVALLVLPGPAILVIPAGLAILGLEFRWARRWLRQGRAALRTGRAHFLRFTRQPRGSACGDPGAERKGVRNPLRRSPAQAESLLK